MAAQSPTVNKKEFEITEIVHETPDVDIFKLEDEDGTKLSFNPGMFVMLTYTDPSTKAEITRAFSIASGPDVKTLEFYIHMIHGRFTSKLEGMKVGDKLKVTGPYGQFKFIPSDDKKILLIAGGTGLAPMMSILQEIKNSSTGNDAILLYSVRYPNEIIEKGKLDDLASHITLNTTITVTRESDEPWSGERGHIDSAMVKRHCTDYSDRTVYVCGPLAFVKAMKEVAEDLGIKSEKIKADVWG